MPDLYLYSTPAHASLELTLDEGLVLEGEPCSANGRNDAHRFIVPAGTNRQGATLHLACDGRIPLTLRGIVDLDDGTVTFTTDDFHLPEAAVAPPTPEPAPPRDPQADPMAIINAVHALHDHDLATKEGCGEFTEDCCTALHEQQSADWGHIRKNPGQNQYNSHAVDALMLRWPAGDTQAGIYDIIHDSESPAASPIFLYKGEPDPNLWYYPA